MNIPINILILVITSGVGVLTWILKYVILRRIEKLEEWIYKTHEEKCTKQGEIVTKELKEIIAASETKLSERLLLMQDNINEKIEHVREIVEISLSQK